jgi:uncharacterized LabA/DUF88 family protein
LFYKNERLAVFIDGPSIHGAARGNDMSIDYAKLRDEFARRGNLVRCYYYTPISDVSEHSSIRKLLDFLSYNGFTVRTEMHRETDGNGFKKAMGRLHMQMAMDAIAMADRLDHIVIACGDGVVTPLLPELQRSGVRVSICSSRQGVEGSFVAEDLRRAADNFIDIVALREQLTLERRAAA